ncbi:hypothetical protein ITI46_30755 [Streptomyces oryzae]|uniref:Uncharacterized protein n=1 Tax=Streptomyces oryzae TaxID=1434886 RepID=A0ABS3XKU5_9ACTN|nr:hypothetical protein [Streptomyces oryzae]MBO8195994.1 hypothetical protein [Streptomyces oryzae]
MADQHDPNSMRLLPWVSDMGKPCYLVGEPDGVVATFADGVEERQLAAAQAALAEGHAALAEPAAGALALRLALKGVVASLEQVRRIAESRKCGAYCVGGSRGLVREQESGGAACG